MTIAGLEGRGDGIFGLLAVGSLVNAEGNLGDGVAVVQPDGGDRCD